MRLGRDICSHLACMQHPNKRLGFEASDLRPDESTTNIGLFKAGTGSILEHIDQPLLTLVERERAGHAHLIPHRPLERVRFWSPASSAAATPGS